MKKIIAALLCAAMLISLASCGSSQKKTETSSAAVSSEVQINSAFAEYAKKGQIYGAKFGLGTPVAEIKEYYHYAEDAYWSNPSGVTEELTIAGEGRIRMFVGDTRYYYYEKDESKGVSFIVYYQAAYNYTIGLSSIEDVKTTVGMEPTKAGDTESGDVFFVPGEASGFYKLQYNVGSYTVTFLFNEGVLAATTIADNLLWTV